MTSLESFSLGKIPRALFSAMKSCGGKTLISSSIMSLLARDSSVAPFKCGCDFIDPLYHKAFLNPSLKIGQCLSSNLDLFIYDQETLSYLFLENSKNKDVAIIEGVMGLYDGVGGKTDEKSTNQIAMLTKTPTILILSPEDFDGYNKAVFLPRLREFLSFRENLVRGVILNNCDKATYASLKPILENETNLKPLGYVPFSKCLALENRRLGLFPLWQEENLRERVEEITNEATKFIDIDALRAIMNSAEDFPSELGEKAFLVKNKINLLKQESELKIGVTADEAFCFHNKDNLLALSLLGARLELVSPLRDEVLPKDLDGIYLTGGFLSSHIRELSQNKSFLSSLSNALENGLPSFSEGAGYVYLSSAFSLNLGEKFSLANFFDDEFIESQKLQSFGYYSLSCPDISIFENISSLRLRNFNYFKSINEKASPILRLRKTGREDFLTGRQRKSSFGAVCYFNFFSNLRLPANFLRLCAKNKIEKGKT